MEWVTTTRLLDQLRDFEEGEGWDRFVGAVREPVLRFCRKLGLTASDAEDATQESLVRFARAFREGGYERDKGRLRDWLFGIVYRQVQDTQRRLARGAERAGQADSALWAALPDPHAASLSWQAEWERHVLQQCLRRVEQEVAAASYRAFMGVALEERPAAEVAQELGLSRNAVFLAKHRITKRVRELQAEFEAP